MTGIPGLRVAVSGRADGDMAGEGGARRRFLLRAGMAPDAARVRQVHGARVLTAGPGDGGRLLGDGDGIVTGERGLPLLVLSADCCVGVVAATDGRAAGVFHAGWRGARAGAPAATAAALERQFGVPSAGMIAILGPSIGPCCYEVGEEVAREFPGSMSGRNLDLPAAVRAGLLRAGLPPEAVSPPGPCTRCGDGWFSHRRGDPERQALAAVLD